MKLTHRTTGHQIKVDDASASFWQAAGYREDAEKAPTKKAASKKSSSTKK